MYVASLVFLNQFGRTIIGFRKKALVENRT